MVTIVQTQPGNLKARTTARPPVSTQGQPCHLLVVAELADSVDQREDATRKLDVVGESAAGPKHFTLNK